MKKGLLITLIGAGSFVAKAQCFVKIESGEQHTIALADDGTLWGWGSNTSGECGITPSSNLLVPTQIGTDNDWMEISCGAYHTLALKTDSTLYSWGYNDEGQLGTGDFSTHYTPTLIDGGLKYKSIAAGYYHSLAINSAGYLLGCGAGGEGQLGDNTNSSYSQFVHIGTGTDWDIVCGAIYTSYAVKEDGTLYVAGSNANGEFATAGPSSSSAWMSVTPGVSFIKIDAGFNFAYGLTASGFLYSWGINTNGQLANNSTVAQSSLQAVSTNVLDFDCGPHSAIWMTSTNVYSAGKNGYYQSQNGTTNDALTAFNWNPSFSVLNNPIGVTMGIFSSSVITDDGLVSWGRNDRGICGNNSTTNLTTPTLTYSCTPAGISEIPKANKLEVFPIPASKEINVFVEENCQVSIVSISGAQLASYELVSGTNSINIDAFESGVYFVRSEDGRQTRFVKQ